MNHLPKLFSRSLLSVAVAGGALTLQPVSAQAAATADKGALEEVVVTARKRTENVQNIAESVSAISGSTLKNFAPRDLRDVASFAPNLIISDIAAGPGSPAGISIRGISFQDVEKSFDPAIGVSVDGVFIGTNTGQMVKVIDVKRIEVLRGPQGTLFGKNSIGGVIRVIRTKPTHKLSGKIRAEVGNYKTRNLEGTVSFGLTKDLAVKLTGVRQKRDGYFKNKLTGDRNGKENYKAGTVDFLYDPTDNLEFRYIYDVSRDNSQAPPLVNMSQPGDLLCFALGQCAQSLSKPQSGDRYKTVQNGRNDAFLDVDAHTFKAHWDINGQWQMDYIFGYRKERENAYIDFDASPINFFQVERPQHYTQISHELRFSYDNHNNFNIVMGLYDWHSQYTLKQNFLTFGYIQKTHQESDSWAGYFEGDYDFAPDWTLTVGGRFTKEKKQSGNFVTNPAAAGYSINNIEHPVDKSWDKFTPKVSLKYQITPSDMTYVTYSSGFRSGGFNGRPGTYNAAVTPYNPETVQNLEGGFKTSWWDGRVRWNGAVFYMKYDHKQEEVQRPVPGGSGQETVVANAATANIWGAETELQARPIEGLTLRADVGYLNAKYDKFKADVNGDGIVTDNSNLKLRRAPHWTTTLAGTYQWNMLRGRWWVSASWHHVTNYAITFFNNPATRVSSYNMVDASVNYEINNVKFSVYGRNLDKVDQWSHALSVAGLFEFAHPMAPRTYGLEVQYKFGQ